MRSSIDKLALSLLVAGLTLASGYAWSDEGRPEAKPPPRELSPSISNSDPSPQRGAARGLQPMSDLMRDTAEEMRAMSRTLANGPASAAERKRVAERMKQMAALMTRMSGLTDEAALADAQTQAQMLEMRREMDGMRKNPLRHATP